MVLTFHRTDANFAENLATLRRATISGRGPVSKFLNVIVDGLAVDASTAHVRPDGWVAISVDWGEHRVPLDTVSIVKAYFWAYYPPTPAPS